MSAATTVEAAATAAVETTTTADMAAAARESATVSAPSAEPTRSNCATLAAAVSAVIATGISATVSTAVSTPVAVSATESITTAISVAAAIAVTAPSMTPAPAIPGTCANKDAPTKPGRAVVAIGCTSIGIIGVIAPIANGRTIVNRRWNHFRANPHPHCDLGMSRDCREWQRQDHCEQNRFQTLHCVLLVPSGHTFRAKAFYPALAGPAFACSGHCTFEQQEG